MPNLLEPVRAHPSLLQNRRFLLVDDDRLNTRILAGILKAEGAAVAEAISGEAAVALYPEFRPDLVLLDVVMPGIDGFETCRRLKAQHGEDCAPVIFITARIESDDIVEGLAAGGADYLTKPIRAKEALARIRVHIQNRALHEEQRLLVGQLSLANAAKNRLLGMAAHDLRNPLASIRAFAEFLSDGTVGELTPKQLELVGTIHSASQSMLTLVNELLDLSVIQAGELKLDREATAIAPLILRLISLANVQAAKKGTTITLADPPPLPLVLIDVEKIKQVIDNLLSNAVKFSPAGSTVRVELAATPSAITVKVCDQGPGIPAGEKNKLFQDFGRTSVRPTGGEMSTGLGLAICKKLMEAHHGTIGAENESTGGCTFMITLPLGP